MRDIVNSFTQQDPTNSSMLIEIYVDQTLEKNTRLNCEAEIWIFARMLSNKDRFKCRSKLVLSDHSVREPPERVGARANLLQDHLCARKVALFYPIHTLQGLLRFLMSLPYKQFLTQIPLI